MDTSFYLVSAIAVLLTGISKSGFAGGLGILAIPAMSLFVSPQVATGIMLPILCIMDIANLWKYHKVWVREYVMLLIPGALIGLALGTVTFYWINASMLKIAIGFLAIWFVLQYLIGLARKVSGEPVKNNKWHCLFIGTLSGWTSFVAHAGGPPIKGFLLSQNMDKTQFVATNSIFFFVINFLKIIPYFFLGQFTSESLMMSLALLPLVPIGVLLGFRLHNVVDQVLFTRIVYVLLAFAGMKLLWDGVMTLQLA